MFFDHFKKEWFLLVYLKKNNNSKFQHSWGLFIYSFSWVSAWRIAECPVLYATIVTKIYIEVHIQINSCIYPYTVRTYTNGEKEGGGSLFQRTPKNKRNNFLNSYREMRKGHFHNKEPIGLGEIFCSNFLLLHKNTNEKLLLHISVLSTSLFLKYFNKYYIL